MVGWWEEALFARGEEAIALGRFRYSDGGREEVLEAVWGGAVLPPGEELTGGVCTVVSVIRCVRGGLPRASRVALSTSQSDCAAACDPGDARTSPLSRHPNSGHLSWALRRERPASRRASVVAANRQTVVGSSAKFLPSHR